MRVMSKYYSRITLDRIANLLEMKLDSSHLVSKEFTVHQTLFTDIPVRQMHEKMAQEKAKISGVPSAQKSGSSENAPSDQNPSAQQPPANQAPKPENQAPQNAPSQTPPTSTRTGIGKQNNSTQNQKK
ncbi:hypothetical protein WR25_15610 [Diploscapter pachys]|uniref:PCI domain-containing protein n=1 Tax=Diploscapter pachys TaxID=2018661 RepID=A0A2A2M0V4_9BILA|nr:hypothetical protein WR25_15610 [Diploscapter pachys]